MVHVYSTSLPRKKRLSTLIIIRRYLTFCGYISEIPIKLCRRPLLLNIAISIFDPFLIRFYAWGWLTHEGEYAISTIISCVCCIIMYQNNKMANSNCLARVHGVRVHTFKQRHHQLYLGYAESIQSGKCSIHIKVVKYVKNRFSVFHYKVLQNCFVLGPKTLTPQKLNAELS